MKRIVQVVRRFGPTGGMEKTVWELTRALAGRGEQLAVICETSEAEAIDGVAVTTLGTVSSGHRWSHHLRFNRRVLAYRRRHALRDDIWHHHEMVTCAEVGTFHSTTHGAGERALHKRLDPTWHINRWLERRVMAAPTLQVMVPVSKMVRNQLAASHPRWMDKLVQPISPGVSPPENPGPSIVEPVLGFMGREWKRKGLLRVIEILRELPEAKLVIAGVPPHEIRGLLSGLENRVEMLGWISNPEDFYHRIGLLVHPARLEAYGMVVAEALAWRIPVLTSEATGASEEVGTAGRVLPHTAPVGQWIQAARELLATSLNEFPPPRTWDEVAADYEALYTKIRY